MASRGLQTWDSTNASSHVWKGTVIIFWVGLWTVRGGRAAIGLSWVALPAYGGIEVIMQTTTPYLSSTQKSTTAFSRSTQTTTTAFSRSSQALTVLASGGGLLHRPPINLRSASNRLMFATRSMPYRFRRSGGRHRSDPSPTSFRLQMHPGSTSDRLQMHHMVI